MLVRPEPYRTLPPPRGWSVVAHALTRDRQLARICAMIAPNGAGQRRPAGDPGVPPGTAAHIELFDAHRRIPGPDFELETRWPLFDRLADGSWVVAAARCPVGETNARILGSDGTVLSCLCLGDGIAHLRCDAAGGIWVGYFDEGVFGTLGWGYGDGEPTPIGAAGIVRFDSDGVVLPVYRPADRPGPEIFDCRAFDLAPDAAWCCPYPDFPVVRAGVDGALRVWRNPAVAGASVLAVDADHVVLLGGYAKEAGRGALLHLGRDEAELVARFDFAVAENGLKSLALAAACGEAMHFVAGATWYRMTVADVTRRLFLG
jgi:hypothetical protein